MTTDEVRQPGDPPRWELAGWRERFGVVAGVTGRATAAGEAFDLGLGTASPVARVMAQLREFRAALPGFPRQVMAHQVHGDRVLWHDATDPGRLIVDGAERRATVFADRPYTRGMTVDVAYLPSDPARVFIVGATPWTWWAAMRPSFVVLAIVAAAGTLTLLLLRR